MRCAAGTQRNPHRPRVPGCGRVRRRLRDARCGRAAGIRRRAIGSRLASAPVESSSDRFAIAFHATERCARLRPTARTHCPWKRSSRCLSPRRASLVQAGRVELDDEMLADRLMRKSRERARSCDLGRPARTRATRLVDGPASDHGRERLAPDRPDFGPSRPVRGIVFVWGGQSSARRETGKSKNVSGKGSSRSV
jgi:hypothetical protein